MVIRVKNPRPTQGPCRVADPEKTFFKRCAETDNVGVSKKKLICFLEREARGFSFPSPFPQSVPPPSNTE